MLLSVSVFEFFSAVLLCVSCSCVDKLSPCEVCPSRPLSSYACMKCKWVVCEVSAIQDHTAVHGLMGILWLYVGRWGGSVLLPPQPSGCLCLCLCVEVNGANKGAWSVAVMGRLWD